MNWGEINPVIIAVFTRLALEDEAVPPDGWSAQWTERSRKFTQPDVGGDLYLKVTSCQSSGDDELRREMRPINPDDEDSPEDLFETLCGIRRFTLQVQARIHEHTDEHWAIQTLEQIATRLGRPREMRALLDVGVVVVDTRDAVKATVTIDGRRVSVGNMDVIMTAVSNDFDPVPIGWCEHISMTSNMKVGDTRLPDPLNVTDEVIPPLPDP